MRRRPDALVVGAGVVGAACARALSSEGLDVLVLDAAFVGAGATAAGMGHIVVMDDSEAQLRLTRYSQRLLVEVADELAADVELQRCGTLWIAEDVDQLEAVRAKHALYAGFGIPTEILDEAGLARAEPRLRRGLAGALRVPEDAVLYPPALARWLLARARDAGARLREGTRVDRIEAGAVVLEAGERIDTGIVVNAAGAAAPRLTPGLPIVPRKGHLVITDRASGFCSHQLVELGYLRSAHTMTAGASVAFNLQPRATGQVLIGSSRELVGWDSAIHRPTVSRMLARALEFVPSLGALSAIRTWTGFRPATPDKLPLIGPWPDADGVWIAAGHEGLGITTALGTGRLIADLVVGRSPAIDPAPFAPDRVRIDRTSPPAPAGRGG